MINTTYDAKENQNTIYDAKANTLYLIVENSNCLTDLKIYFLSMNKIKISKHK